MDRQTSWHLVDMTAFSCKNSGKGFEELCCFTANNLFVPRSIVNKQNGLCVIRRIREPAFVMKAQSTVTFSLSLLILPCFP